MPVEAANVSSLSHRWMGSWSLISSRSPTMREGPFLAALCHRDKTSFQAETGAAHKPKSTTESEHPEKAPRARGGKVDQLSYTK